MKKPTGVFYYHYKHNPDGGIEDYAYEFLGVGYHTEIEDMDKAAMVVYRPLYKRARVYKAGKHWDVRPLAMFMEKVVKDGKPISRFTKITNPKVILQLKKIRNQMYGSK